MSKVAVIYWSGTGNTEMMAQAVAEGAKEAGAEVSLMSVSETNADDAAASTCWHWDARLWVLRFWKRWNLTRSLPNWNPS